MVLGIIPPVLLLVLWWLVTCPESPAENRLINRLLLPSLRETFEAIGSLWLDWEVSRSALSTLIRVCGGYLIALVVAMPLGILMGSFSKIKAVFNPLVVVGTYVPLPALAVLMLPWAVVVAGPFGADSLEVHKYIFLAVVTFIVLLPQVVLALENVDDIYLQTAYCQGANRWQVVRKVLVPVSMPYLFNALRTSFAIGWTYIILAEMWAAERGLGYIITIAERRSKMEISYLTVMVVMIIGFVSDRLWVRLGRWLMPYHTIR